MLASRLRLWFGLSDRVDRRAYFATGLGFMALKYLSDSAVVWAYTGRVWSPLDYANPVWSVREHALQGVPSAVVLALAVWTLPFLWVGIGMSVRRAVDAGRSAWLALLFFVPYVNYLLMLALSLLLFAAEGGVCLLMALPLAAPVALLGGVLGRAIAVRGEEPPSHSSMAAILALLVVAVEPRATAPPREVVTVVEIAAPPEVVW